MVQLKAIAARKAGMSVAFWKCYDIVRLRSRSSIQEICILVEYRDMPDRRLRRENLVQRQSRFLLLNFMIKTLSSARAYDYIREKSFRSVLSCA